MDAAPTDLVLTLECLLPASPSRVFAALTEPHELAQWWGPHGFTIPDVQLDLNVSGLYRFAMQPPEGELFHLTGEFLEIDPPSRLVYTFRWEEPDPDDRETVVWLTIEPAGETTKVSLWQGTFATEERLELHRGGWTESFEKLQAFLGAPAQPRP
jgi:uncharacterized protein YndB with AHSA1/START domain